MAALIYLASPYSHPSAAVREARYLAARALTIEELRLGSAIFSPIVYGKDMETAIGTAFEPWAAFNDTVIEKCDEVWVLCIEGWQQSRGIRHELEVAFRLNKTVRYLDPKGEFVNAYP